MALIEITGVVPDGSDYGPGVPANVRQAIKMTKGVDLTVRMRLVNPRGAKVDVVNVAATHVLTIKKNPSDAPGLVSRAGAPQPQLGSNVVDFVLSPNDTRLLADGNFGYDIFSTIAGKRDATVPLSPWKIEPAMGLLNAPVTSVSLVPLTIFGLPLNGLVGQVIGVTALDPFTIGWVAVSGRAPAISVLGAVDVEDPVGVLGPRRRLTYDDIDPAFALTSFSAPTIVNHEIGDPITDDPAFTASANQAIATATLNDGTGAISLTAGLPGTPIAFAYGTAPLPSRAGGSAFVKTVPGQSVTITLIAHNAGGATSSSSHSATWTARTFFGNATPGVFDEAFIEALSSVSQKTARGGSYAFADPAAAGKKLYIAYPSSYGAPATVKDQNNFDFPMVLAAGAVSVTNGFGVTTSYDVYESANFINGFAFTLAVT